MRNLSMAPVLLLVGCGTFQLASGVYPLIAKTPEQQQLDNLNCKDQAKLEANSTERQTGAFLLGMTIIGAPLAFEMEKSKQREVYKSCMEGKGYRIVAPNDGQSASSPPAQQVPVTVNPSPGTVKPSPSGSRTIAVQWPRYQDLLSGRVAITENGKNGTFRLTLPTNEGNCIGTYETKDLKTGNWVFSCPGGISATGNLAVNSTNGLISGTGADSDGKKIAFTIGN